MPYSIDIDPRAIKDIQLAIDYYDEQQIGLGEKFEKALNQQLLLIEKNPYFQVRYDDIHCLPLKKFQYMVHFTINEESKTVTVRAIFHTSLSPKIWKKR